MFKRNPHGCFCMCHDCFSDREQFKAKLKIRERLDKAEAAVKNACDCSTKHTCEPKCDFCPEPCGNEWCCMKDKK